MAISFGRFLSFLSALSTSPFSSHGAEDESFNFDPINTTFWPVLLSEHSRAGINSDWHDQQVATSLSSSHAICKIWKTYTSKTKKSWMATEKSKIRLSEINCMSLNRELSTNQFQEEKLYCSKRELVVHFELSRRKHLVLGPAEAWAHIKSSCIYAPFWRKSGDAEHLVTYSPKQGFRAALWMFDKVPLMRYYNSIFSRRIVGPWGSTVRSPTVYIFWADK